MGLPFSATLVGADPCVCPEILLRSRRKIRGAHTGAPLQVAAPLSTSVEVPKNSSPANSFAHRVTIPRRTNPTWNPSRHQRKIPNAGDALNPALPPRSAPKWNGPFAWLLHRRI